MTKQDFELIADVIAGLKDVNEFLRKDIAESFADRLIDVNERFDRKKFLSACGV